MIIRIFPLPLVRKAKLLLKKKRYLESLLDKTDGQLDNLEQLVSLCFVWIVYLPSHMYHILEGNEPCVRNIYCNFKPALPVALRMYVCTHTNLVFVVPVCVPEREFVQCFVVPVCVTEREFVQCFVVLVCVTEREFVQ